MHNTRRELLDDFLIFVGDKDDDEARTIAEGCLTRALLTIWLKLPWRAYRSPVPLELTLVPNQRRYALPDYFGRIGPGEIRNATRGGERLHRLQDGELEARFPVAGTSFEQPGIPQRYEIAGTCGVYQQPAVTGEIIEVTSEHENDTDVVVSIAGDDELGRWTRDEVTLDGRNAVEIGTWSFIDEVGKSFVKGTDAPTPWTTSRGIVTIRKQSDGTVLQTLFPQESSKQHDILAIFPKPNAADTLLLPIIRKPKRLFEDADALPDLWAPALFEEMSIDWQVNAGELQPGAAAAMARPRLDDLVGFENQQKPHANKRPFGRY